MVSQLLKFFKKASFKSTLADVLFILKCCFISFVGISLFYTVCFSFVPPRRTPLMLKRNIEYYFEKSDTRVNYQWVSIEKISPHLWQAVVASEDNNFMKHHGIDLGAIRKAQAFNKRSLNRKRGASTISQQTAKNVFLWPARTYLRKGFEVYFTLFLETVWSKKRVMEMYLNVIEMGPGIYGAEAAAQHYFHKPASKLTRSEAALLAISLPNPRKRNPARPTGYMLRRQQQILYLMPKITRVEF
jgi:monofunctional biosynthetic peptidoglycan transglycosylase